MIFMWIIPLLLVGLVVWAVVEATRRHDHYERQPYYPQSAASASSPAPAPGGAPTPSARALLDERYARGEIGRDEYLERKKDLG